MLVAAPCSTVLYVKTPAAPAASSDRRRTVTRRVSTLGTWCVRLPRAGEAVPGDVMRVPASRFSTEFTSVFMFSR